MRAGRLLAGAALLATASMIAPWAWHGARAEEAPIRIGVIAEASTISAAAIPNRRTSSISMNASALSDA